MFSRITPVHLLSRALLLSVALAGCATPAQQVGQQGPSGGPEVVAPIMLESYLIPPEIPRSLVSYVLESEQKDSEVVSISVVGHSGNEWTLQISRERLPSESITEVITLVKSGNSWREK